jgi:hypothetical protein
MGFNFQGLAINRLYTSAVAIADDFNIPAIEFVGESNFEESTMDNISSTAIYITRINDSSFCTFGADINIEEIAFRLSSDANFKAVRFAIYETSMAFAFEYFKGLHCVRSKFVFPEQTTEEKGEPLPIEKSETDMTEIIFNLIGELCGVDFWDIELETKSMHYKL